MHANPLRLIALLFLLIVAACSRAGSDAPATQTHPPGSPAAIAAATVAQKTGSSEDAVVIRSVEAVDFGDSSLGCPQPGMAYLQVITPGYKVVAEAIGKTFDVRVAGARGLICDPRAGREGTGRQGL
jgi:hypothetical protein